MAKKTNDEITNSVYEYRVLKRMTQQDLAKAVGVSRQTIIVMEKNKYTPSLLLAFKIAEFFDADIHDIFKYKPGGQDD
ncbi:transcriptional regulator [Halobacillus fulvus]|nr:transcriptional regulator [Halobacillus fulvus]